MLFAFLKQCLPLHVKLPTLPRLRGERDPAIFPSLSSSARIVDNTLPNPAFFTWMLGVRTQALMLVWQALDWLSRALSPWLWF